MWSSAAQDRTTGQFIEPARAPDPALALAAPRDPLLDHLAATLAIHEHFLASRSVLLQTKARRGIGFIRASVTSSADLEEWSDASLALAQRLVVSTQFSGLWLEPADLIAAEIKRRLDAGESSAVLQAGYVSTLSPGPEQLAAATKLLALENSPALKAVIGSETYETARQALEFWLVGDALHEVAALNARSFAAKIEEALLVPVARQARLSGGLSPDTRAAEILARGIRYWLLL